MQRDPFFWKIKLKTTLVKEKFLTGTTTSKFCKNKSKITKYIKSDFFFWEVIEYFDDQIDRYHRHGDRPPRRKLLQFHSKQTLFRLNYNNNEMKNNKFMYHEETFEFVDIECDFARRKCCLIRQMC